MALHDEATRLDEALERGKLEGSKTRSISIAKNLISMGLVEEDIVITI